MSQGWENHEPAPMEFFHAELMRVFHEWRKKRVAGNEINVLINGGDLNDMIAAVKMETYRKYPKHVSRKAIPKNEI